MIEILDVPTLFKLCLAVGFAQVGGWLVLGRAFNFPPYVAGLFAGANGFFVLSLILVARRQEVTSYLTIQGAGVAVALSLLCMRVGLQGHLHVPATWRENVVHLIIFLGAAFSLAPASESQPLLSALVGLSVCVTLARAAGDIHPVLIRDYGWPAAVLIELPFWIFSLTSLLGRSLPAFSEALEPTGIKVSMVTTVTFALLSMLALAWININLLGLSVGKLIRKIRQLAERDMLTGVWNRRAIEARLREERARLVRSAEPFSLVMMDLDYFKRVNDTLGHAAGDAALKHATTVVASTLRTVDSLGRYGGEEFIVLLPMTDRDGARDAAERMRTVLAGTPMLWEDEPLTITASFGVATASEATLGEDELFRRADLALYAAKAGGRNRVEVDGST